MGQVTCRGATIGKQLRVKESGPWDGTGVKSLRDAVPEARVELARGCPRRILSPLRLPFRHSGYRDKIIRSETGRTPFYPAASKSLKR
jgi:hypothetical protein